tara:strand:- start:211 stop:513 length:303 start_codon:yes stop_codon:yes gene_type:complete
MKNKNTLRKELQTWLELSTRVANNMAFNKDISWDDIESVSRENLHVPDYITQSGESVSFIEVMGDAVVIDQIASGGSHENEPYCELALHMIQKYRGIKLY